MGENENLQSNLQSAHCENFQRYAGFCPLFEPRSAEFPFVTREERRKITMKVSLRSNGIRSASLRQNGKGQAC